MNYFSPVWHPTLAKNYYTLYNNLNQDNNILYYDTTNNFIEYPKIFTYKRTNSNYGLKLSKVVTNNASSDPIYNSSLPSTEGKFTINKIVPDSGASAPTIDLYFQGNIRTQEGNWDIDNHSYITWNISSISPSTFDASSENYGLNRTISIKYSVSYSFDKGYEYSSYYIRFTINWGRNSSNNYVYIQTQNANGTVTLAKPSTFINDVFPTITVSGRLYSKQSAGPGPEPEEYIEISRTGTILGNTVIREAPSADAEVIASVAVDSSAYFTLRTKNSNWYYSEYDGGWVHSSRIRLN